MDTDEDMGCQELVELVTAYLEDALDESTERRFVQHLDICDGCRTYLDQMRTTLQVVGAIPAETLDPVARDRLLTAFRGWSTQHAG